MSDQPGGFNPAQRSHSFYRRVVLLLVLWASIATLFGAYTVFQSFILTTGEDEEWNTVPQGKRNVIFMVSDGMGPASVALARNYFQHTLHGDKDNNFKPGGHFSDLSTIELDKHFIGNSRTQSSNSYVTDSAAGATAFSCGLKTYNGAIGVDSDAQPCATIMEAAKLMGYRTGLVVTTRITDATPASFASHALDRSEEDSIAEQLVNFDGAHPFGSVVDLVFGGGRCHFLPQGAPGSCRSDTKDLIESAVSDGWKYVDDIHGLRELELGHNVPSLPLLGLFANLDMPFSIDYHDEDLPRLNETALTAVNALAAATKDSEQGFFLMVEGSRIDHAGHSNDPAAQVREVLAYSEALAAMTHFAENADVPTIVLSTSDHETGGLSVSRQVTPSYPDYLWRPEILDRAQHSTEYLARKLRHFARKKHHSRDDIAKFIETTVVGKHGLGWTDVTKSEIQELVDNSHDVQNTLTRMLSIRAQVGWSTHGHSAVDVNVYGASNYPHALDPVRGGNENIGLGEFLRNFLKIEAQTLQKLTMSLRERFGDQFSFEGKPLESA